MAGVDTGPGTLPDFGLLVLEEGKPQQVLAKFLNLMLNYQYGLSIMVTSELGRAGSMLQVEGRQVRCVLVIQREPVTAPVVLETLSHKGEIPIILIMPTKRLGVQRIGTTGLQGIHFCAWEQAFSGGNGSLERVVGKVMEEQMVGNLQQIIEDVPYAALQERVERRLRSINTLPTLPEIVIRIMRLVNDPNTTPEEMEKVLCTDPSIVMKLLRVMRSPVFTGTGGRTSTWTLKEIITRLGVKKIGAIAQQVKIINSLVKPEESDFDLKRFWQHSVGSAIIADRLYTDQLVKLGGEVEFNDYWISALLHDVGKLVLGFFFWEWLERVQSHRTEKDISFREAERELGDVANHQRVGQLMLLNADMGEGPVGVVGAHHEGADDPSDLLCLVHIANNLSREIGLSYLPGEPTEYDEGILGRSGLTRDTLAELREKLQTELVEEITTVVSQCM